MKKNVYVSSCCDDGGIYQYELVNKVLHEKSVTPLESPMYTIIEGNTMYALIRELDKKTGFSGLTSYKIGVDGGLTNKGEALSTEGKVACHLCRNDGFTYAVNYVSGSVAKIPGRVVTHNGKSVHPTRQDAAHTHFVNKTPDGKYLYAVDLGMDKIFTYDFDLNEVCTSTAQPGEGPRHIVFSRNGSLAYCANELANTIRVYGYSDGHFVPKNSYNTLSDGFKGEKSTAAAIRLWKNYVLVSNRGDDTIAVFEQDGENLKRLCVNPCGGSSPRDFDVVEDTLICTNESGNNVTVFDITDITNWKQTQEIKIAAPLCVTIF